MNIIKTLLELSAYSSAMIIVVFAVKAIFNGKINMKIVLFLWTLVLLRLIIPVTLNSPINLDNIIIRENKTNESETEQPLIVHSENYEPIENIPPETTNLSAESFENNVANTEVSIPKATLVEKAIKLVKSISIWSYLMIIWIAGMMFLILRSIFDYIGFYQRVKWCKTIDKSEIINTVNSLKETLSIKQNIEVILSRYVQSPITFGLIKPKIILPINLMNRISNEKFVMILLHELCHIKRKDIFYNILWMIAKTVHWFNPLVWIAYKNYIDDNELSCDEMVLSYLDEEQSFIYSQSLVDVTRVSKSIVRLPAALSFCKEKSKIRKRVENMLRPKKKLKSAGFMSIFLAVIMIVTCFTTACQPTPEKEVVQSKNDGELEQAMEQTAAPTEPTETEEPKIIIQDTSSNASNTVTVEINAEIINNQPDKIPVAKIEPYYFTGDDVERMAKAFFGDTQFYQGTMDKSDYDKRILNMQYKISSDEELLKSDHATAGGVTDLTELRNHYQKSLDRLIEARNNAPDEKPEVNNFDDIIESDWSYMGAYADLGTGYMGEIRAGEESICFTAFEDDALYPPGRNLYATLAQLIDTDSENAEFQNAKNMAIDMMERMGFDNVTLGDSYFTEDSGTIWQSYDGVEAGRQYYVFCFEKNIGDSKLDHTFATADTISYFTMAPKDPYSDTEEVYEQVREYEELEVWIEGDKFVQFLYARPMQVTDIVNENVAINVDYTEAIEIAKQYAHVTYIDPHGNFSEVKVKIDKIELVLVREKQKDSSDYIVVPSWNFYGKLDMKYAIDDQSYKVGDWRSDYNICDFPLLTINALDGSVTIN